MQRKASRVRLSCALAVLGLAAAEIGCGENANPTQPVQLSDGAAAATEGVASSALFPLGPQLAAVRRATARFHDISAAHAAGYSTEDEPCVASPDGAMGIHAVNQSLIGDQLLDPLQPELLLYMPHANGGYRLVGVEYFQVVLLRNPATQEVQPWFSEDPWPPDYEVVNPTPRLFGQVFQGPMPGHAPNMPWHWDLHVWIWAHNPSGMFAVWNPALSCE